MSSYFPIIATLKFFMFIWLLCASLVIVAGTQHVTNFMKRACSLLVSDAWQSNDTGDSASNDQSNSNFLEEEVKGYFLQDVGLLPLAVCSADAPKHGSQFTFFIPDSPGSVTYYPPDWA